MCIGLANGVPNEMDYMDSKSLIDDLGRVIIPNEMLKKLGIVDGDVLRITATETLIIIEKCEGDEE